MHALGHQRFAVVGHDTGLSSATRSPPITRTASTARPHRGARAPGAGDARTLMFVPDAAQQPALAPPVNRLEGSTNSSSGAARTSTSATSSPSRPGSSFPRTSSTTTSASCPIRRPARQPRVLSRAGRHVEQNAQRSKRPLTMPVLTIGGAARAGASRRRRDDGPRDRPAERGDPRRRPLGRRGGSPGNCWRRSTRSWPRIGPAPRRLSHRSRTASEAVRAAPRDGRGANDEGSGGADR